MMRPLVLSSLLGLVVLVAGAAGLGGCASGDPSVSGIPIFNQRNVFVGDTVTISLPADLESGDTWRLRRFDSSILRPQPGSEEFRNGRISFKFTAAVPGEADLEFQRIKAGRSVDQRRTYRVVVRGSI